MEISFIAGFGPITRDEGARDFWGGSLGVPLAEVAPGYWGTDEEELAGARAFALWPLAQAAQAVFGLVGTLIGGPNGGRLIGSVAAAAVSTVVQVYMLVMLARLYRQAVGN